MIVVDTSEVIQRSDLEYGLGLFERYQELGAFDAVLAAVALSREADALVSADTAFRHVANLTYVDPASPELDGLFDRM